MQTPAWIWQASCGQTQGTVPNNNAIELQQQCPVTLFPQKKSTEDLRGKSHSQLWLAGHVRDDNLNTSTNQVSVSELFILHQPLKSSAAL